LKKRTTLMSAAAVVSLSALLAGCSGGIGADAAARHDSIPNGGTMVQTFPTTFGTNLIPFMDASAYTATAVGYSFDSILQFNRNAVLEGDLVDKWSYSPDRTTIYFWLNPKARWSNGLYVTSKDVELGVDWLASKSYNTTYQGEYGYLVANIKGVPASGYLPDGQTPSGFKILGPREFSISMNQPDAAVLPSQWSGITPLPWYVLGNLPMSQWKSSAFNKMPNIGSGPYIMKGLVPGQSITQVANPYYVFGKPHIETNIWKVVSADVVTGQLASGQVTIAGIQAKDYKKMVALPNISVDVTPSNGFSYLGWRLNNSVYGKEFSNVKFRQAVEYAIDRNALVQAIDKGFGKPENGPLPPINGWYNPALNGTYAYSPAMANKLLDEAGFKIVNGWRTTPGGRPFAPTITISSGDTQIAVEANFLKQYLNAVHINVKISAPINFNTILNELDNDANGKQNIQGFFLAWSLGTDPDPRGLWRSTDNLNLTTIDWSNKKDPAIVENDKLIHLQHTAAAFDYSYRKNILDQWQVLLNQQLPENFLTMDDGLTAYNKSLHGVVFSPYGLLHPYEWYLTPSN